MQINLAAAKGRERNETVAVEDVPEEVTTISMEDRDSADEVPEMSRKIKNRYGMRRHFMHRHLNDKIIIEEEGGAPRDARTFAEMFGVQIRPPKRRRAGT
jgi:hypothetical protein